MSARAITIEDEHEIAALTSKDGSGPLRADATNTRLFNHVLAVSEELRQARAQLALYGESLLAVQRSILPQQLPNVPGLDLAVYFCEADRVGGDFYDVVPVAPGRWAIFMCDVSGHGLAAAATLALVHALGNMINCQKTPPPPGAALALINKPLATRYLANSGQFVTAFVAIYDVETQTLTYSSAGHPYPRLVRGSEVHRLDGASGMPLGLDQTSVYFERSVQLLPGDRLVLFTDGVIESTNAAHDFFGDERLDAVVRTPAGSAAELVRHMVVTLQSFRAGRAAIDDETCLVALVNPDRAGALCDHESEINTCQRPIKTTHNSPTSEGKVMPPQPRPAQTARPYRQLMPPLI
jgi:phosphoserine phosphatase RsbU/P